MKTQWLMIVMLLLPSPLAAKIRHAKHTVINYGKALDVAQLDPTLSPQRLDVWLKSGPAHLATVWWDTSDCDLVVSGDPNYVTPLCVEVRFMRGDALGIIIIRVGTFHAGIVGKPHLQSIRVAFPGPRVLGSDKLSALPELLQAASGLRRR